MAIGCNVGGHCVAAGGAYLRSHTILGTGCCGGYDIVMIPGIAVHIHLKGIPILLSICIRRGALVGMDRRCISLSQSSGVLTDDTLIVANINLRQCRAAPEGRLADFVYRLRNRDGAYESVERKRSRPNFRNGLGYFICRIRHTAGIANQQRTVFVEEHSINGSIRRVFIFDRYLCQAGAQSKARSRNADHVRRQSNRGQRRTVPKCIFTQRDQSRWQRHRRHVHAVAKGKGTNTGTAFLYHCTSNSVRVIVPWGGTGIIIHLSRAGDGEDAVGIKRPCQVFAADA